MASIRELVAITLSPAARAATRREQTLEGSEEDGLGEEAAWAGGVGWRGGLEREPAPHLKKITVAQAAKHVAQVAARQARSAEEVAAAGRRGAVTGVTGEVEEASGPAAGSASLPTAETAGLLAAEFAPAARVGAGDKGIQLGIKVYSRYGEVGVVTVR
jgi:hypothetical protein